MLRCGRGSLPSWMQPADRVQSLDHGGNAGCVVLRALLGRMSENEHLFFAAGSPAARPSPRDTGPRSNGNRRRRVP